LQILLASSLLRLKIWLGCTKQIEDFFEIDKVNSGKYFLAVIIYFGNSSNQLLVDMFAKSFKGLVLMTFVTSLSHDTYVTTWGGVPLIWFDYVRDMIDYIK